MTGDPVLISFPELARRLGVSRSFLYHEADRGRLGFVRLGRRRLVPAPELTRYLAARTTTASDDPTAVVSLLEHRAAR